ncbi:LysR family transcriptional regulator [Croceicoccus hydrothermalis]|uniref:LysR family transcriptional regulator n=1 Tax=Croceicoccus hydrothermalis TaxID=2867964 RepID=UPI001EFAA4FB|nr:LysR family transcriptional regulator [Croceicoccus hydrothermalis]
MIERYLVRYFLAVVEQGTFSAAAASAQVSQPTLSSGIAKLERLLGTVLFERNNRRVELTTAGTRFMHHARLIEREFAAAERGAADDAPSKLIRIGIASTLPAALTGRAVAAALRAQDAIRIEVAHGRMRDLMQSLRRGRLDLVAGPVPDDALCLRTLFEEPYRLAMREDHPLADRATLTADELVREPMIVRRWCEALPETSRFFTQAGIRPFMASRTTNDETAAALVRAGLGMTVVPACHAAAGLRLVPLDGFAMRRRIGLVAEQETMGRVAGSAAVRALGDVLAVPNAGLDDARGAGPGAAEGGSDADARRECG